MIPYSQINIGDVFSNPLHRNFGKFSGLKFCVVEKNDAEKMIKIQGVSSSTMDLCGEAFWKRNTDRLFSESWRTTF